MVRRDGDEWFSSRSGVSECVGGFHMRGYQVLRIFNGLRGFRRFQACHLCQAIHGLVWKVRHEASESVRNETGSAVVEFLILALPLFLPIIIYLSAIHESSTIRSDLNTLARQVARAYITSNSSDFESARVGAVVSAFESQMLRPQGILEVPDVVVNCQSTPCLTPDSRVEAVVTIVKPASTMAGFFRFLQLAPESFSASDTQIVDAWR